MEEQKNGGAEEWKIEERRTEEQKNGGAEEWKNGRIL